MFQASQGCMLQSAVLLETRRRPKSPVLRQCQWEEIKHPILMCGDGVGSELSRQQRVKTIKSTRGKPGLTSPYETSQPLGVFGTATYCEVPRVPKVRTIISYLCPWQRGPLDMSSALARVCTPYSCSSHNQPDCTEYTPRSDTSEAWLRAQTSQRERSPEAKAPPPLQQWCSARSSSAVMLMYM